MSVIERNAGRAVDWPDVEMARLERRYRAHEYDHDESDDEERAHRRRHAAALRDLVLGAVERLVTHASSTFRRAGDAREYPECHEDDDDATEREEREHDLGDVIVEAFLRPLRDERDERREPDDDGADERDHAEDDVDVHRLPPHVEQREERDPDDVDEVPVQRACREPEIALLRVDTPLRLDEDGDQVGDADEDVETVESGEREERRSVDARRPRRTGVKQVEIFERLPAEEADAEDDRRDHIA